MSDRRKSSVVLSVLVALAICAGAARAWADPQLARGPFLALPGPDTETLVWRTNEPSDAQVVYGCAGGPELMARGPDREVEHRLTLLGLRPGTAYHYQVSSGGVLLKSATFKTLPRDSGPFSFLAFGDNGRDTPAQRELALKMTELAGGADLAVCAGDVDQNVGLEFDEYYFRPYARIIDRLAVMPVLGNHDVTGDGGQSYLKSFPLPLNNPDRDGRFYSFDCADAHFLMLDTNQDVKIGSPQWQWADEDLAATKKRWKFVVLHNPPFKVCMANWHEDSRSCWRNLLPLVEKHKVDLVLGGHHHLYEVAGPINGVVHVIVPSAGYHLATSEVDQSGPWTVRRVNKMGFLKLDVDGDVLRCRLVTADGVDETAGFQLKKSGRPEPLEKAVPAGVGQ